MLLETQCFRFDDFFLDGGEKVLLQNGKPVSLTPKAFQLLFELVKRKGHLIAKEDLMRAVWTDSFVEDGNLAFTIRLLRKALDDDAKNPRFIETVAKRGYRFIAETESIEPENFSRTHIAGTNIKSIHQFSGNTAGNNFAEFQTQKSLEKNQPFTVPVTRSLFGRADEIGTIKNLLLNEDIRLITLTGVGGSGKTSLARVIAADHLSDFRDGIFFIELAPVFNPDFVATSIARMLDVKESAGHSLVQSLQNFLRERQILLILDNFEQVITAAPLLDELIRTAPLLKILVTSRVALRINSENELIIPPLAVPPPSFSDASINPENYPSVQMFVERAKTVKPNFALTAENAADVAAICAELDGLPLAIELAAARIRLLTPPDILKRLENRLQILTSRLNNVPERHQTMRAAIAWSYDLLAEDEKQLFKLLAVFAGGFTVKAAEAICGEKESNDAEILDCLESLIAGNLLRQSNENETEPRLFMLETIREYAAERLAESVAEENKMRGLHADFFLDHAKKMERDLMGANQAELLNWMEAERDNYRAAMDWWRKNDGEKELKLTAALTPLWNFRGSLSEGIERLFNVLEKNPNAAIAARAKALTSLGMLVWVSSDYEKAIEICEKSLSLNEQIDYPIIRAQTLFVLGMSYWYRFENAEKSIAYLKESLDLYRKEKFDTGVVFTTVVLAAIYQTNGDLPKAAQLLDESISAAERSRNNLARSIALVNCGRLKFAEGDYESAKELCLQSLRLREELGDRWGLVQCLAPLTAIDVIEGSLEHAAKMLGAIDVLLETLGAQQPLIFRADHEPSVAAVRAALDEKTFERLFAEGRRLSIKESVALALEESEDFQNENPSGVIRHFAKRFFG